MKLAASLKPYLEGNQQWSRETSSESSIFLKKKKKLFISKFNDIVEKRLQVCRYKLLLVGQW